MGLCRSQMTKVKIEGASARQAPFPNSKCGPSGCRSRLAFAVISHVQARTLWTTQMSNSVGELPAELVAVFAIPLEPLNDVRFPELSAPSFLRCEVDSRYCSGRCRVLSTGWPSLCLFSWPAPHSSSCHCPRRVSLRRAAHHNRDVWRSFAIAAFSPALWFAGRRQSAPASCLDGL